MNLPDWQKNSDKESEPSGFGSLILSDHHK